MSDSIRAPVSGARSAIDGAPLIRCRGLTKSFRKGDRVISPLQALDLEVRSGEFLALRGPSGSGKTTLLNLIAGIDRPSGGELVVGEVDLLALSRARLADWRSVHLGYVFQLYNLVPVLTAYENVELPLLLHRLSARERHRKVEAALRLVGIAHRHDHFPRQLSGGEEQRVAIARAIVADPTIIVGDEPTGDLDHESATAIMELLRRLCDELRKTLIVVTHDARSAAYADRILHLEKGRLVDPAELAGGGEGAEDRARAAAGARGSPP
ncbi:MAG TPA: ABC transporter ATP-binding protein [Phycisphaerales bacterium]|nr:ABC transporter ATP-binding protein [Phycisphaerales bacterium]HMP36485.1 ABC transporter ATP-binding protein [Phycisphaerales bacterium]